MTSARQTNSSEALQATVRRLQVRTEALSERTRALETSSERLKASTNRLRAKTSRLEFDMERRVRSEPPPRESTDDPEEMGSGVQPVADAER